MEKGIGKGQVRLLKLQIQQRFGTLPAEFEERLQTAINPVLLDEAVHRMVQVVHAEQIPITRRSCSRTNRYCGDAFDSSPPIQRSLCGDSHHLLSTQRSIHEWRFCGRDGAPSAVRDRCRNYRSL
jgi:hypothetical protein